MFMKKVALPFMVQLSVPSPFVFILSHFSLLLLFCPPAASSNQVFCGVFKPSPLRPTILLLCSWHDGIALDGFPGSVPDSPRSTSSYFLNYAFVSLQHIFTYLPKKQCVSSPFPEPCLSQKIFILHSYLDDSLAEYDIGGWKSFSYRILKALNFAF